MTPKKRSHTKERSRVQDSLKGLAKQLNKSDRTRAGNIVFHLTGDAGGSYCLECDEHQTALSHSPTAGLARAPLIEVMGDADAVLDILDGKKDALKEFVSGGLRIRGDLRYFSDLAVEMGILKDPL